MSPTSIATAYQLPYRVRYLQPNPLSLGQPVTLKIQAKQESLEAVEDYASIVMMFQMLASTGALAGNFIPPVEAMEFTCTQLTDTSAEWLLAGSRLDDRALVVLAQLLQRCHEEHPISEITFTSLSAGNMTRLRFDADIENPYPGINSAIPFSWVIDPDFYADATLHIAFERNLTEEEGEAIDAWIMIWTIATMMGAYGIAPIPPESCGASFPEEVIIFDDSLEMPFTQFRAHPASLDGLVNACVAIHELFVPIREMRIE